MGSPPAIRSRHVGPLALLPREHRVYLRPFRRVIPPVGMFDLSPIVALIVLYVVNAVVVRVLEVF